MKEEYESKPILEGYEGNDSKPSFWIIFGVLVVFIVIFFIFLYIRFAPNQVNEKELTEGTYVNLDSAREFNFNLNETEHKIILDNLGGDYVDLTIQSEPIKVRIKIGETKKFDLDGDSEYDLLIRLESIEEGRPKLFIRDVKRMRESVRENFEECEENWSCGEWGGCVNSFETRTCNDENNCGTSRNKPIVRKECQSTLSNNTTNQNGTDKNTSIQNQTTDLCFDNNGTICNSTQKCDGNWLYVNNVDMCCFSECVCKEDWVCEFWSNCSQDEIQTRNCEDENKCGTTVFKPDLAQECESSEYLNCASEEEFKLITDGYLDELYSQDYLEINFQAIRTHLVETAYENCSVYCAKRQDLSFDEIRICLKDDCNYADYIKFYNYKCPDSDTSRANQGESCEHEEDCKYELDCFDNICTSPRIDCIEDTDCGLCENCKDGLEMCYVFQDSRLCGECLFTSQCKEGYFCSPYGETEGTCVLGN